VPFVKHRFSWAARSQKEMTHQLIVVGAGLAGLSTTQQARQHGSSSILLEASSRIGGRAFTRRDVFPGATLDMGGEFIGSNHPRWMGYAKEFGLKLEEIEWPATAWAEMEGKLYEGEALRELNAQVEALSEQMTEAARNVDDEKPWETPGAAELDRLSLAEAVNSRLAASEPGKRRFLNAFHQSEAGPPERISWLGQLAVIKGHGLERYWEETEMYRCADGAGRLTERLAATLPDDSIQLKTPVTKISISGDGVVAESADGRRWEGDWLVLTIPPSQWRKIEFDPPLPTHEPLAVGAVSKEFIALKTEFWQPGPSPLATCDSPRGGLSLTSPLRNDNSTACLLWFVAGTPAERLHEIPNAEREERLSEALAPRLPQLADNWQGWFAKDWAAEPFFDGGYSYAQLGKITSWGPSLYEGIGRLQFAGEFASFRFTGYMEGALETAERVCRRILAS
jgi:monoamine oxidase